MNIKFTFEQEGSVKLTRRSLMMGAMGSAALLSLPTRGHSETTFNFITPFSFSLSFSSVLYADAAEMADDISIDDSAAGYASDAITQYELFRSLANDTAADRSKLALADTALKQMRQMAPDTAE